MEFHSVDLHLETNKSKWIVEVTTDKISKKKKGYKNNSLK